MIYIYAMENDSMTGVYKVGMSIKMLSDTILEANLPCEWNPPLSYKLTMSVLVSDPYNKLIELQSKILQYRINPNRDFFRISHSELVGFCKLIGYCNIQIPEDRKHAIPIGRCRDTKKCFINNQKIRHVIRAKQAGSWECTYDSASGKLRHNGNLLTMNKFATNHYKATRPDRTPNCNAWKECECEINGMWGIYV